MSQPAPDPYPNSHDPLVSEPPSHSGTGPSSAPYGPSYGSSYPAVPYGTPVPSRPIAPFGSSVPYGTAASHPGQPPHQGHPFAAQQPAWSPGVGVPMTPDQERTWAVGAHLSSVLMSFTGLGLVGPLIVMLIIGDRSPFARRHAVEALNFNLTVLIAAIVGVVLTFVLIGIPMLVVLVIGYFVGIVAGSVAASRGDEFHYPLSIRFVR